MKALSIDEFVGTECQIHPHSLDEYEADTPRWCKGCGDHGVLLTIQQILRDQQVDPEHVVAVSGIGCSSRLPHYLRTYGFHGIHGRALPVSLGVKLARPELQVLTVMGDGDCFSIGAAHWVHAIRYNIDITVVVLDNGVYALTKKQVSPTSPQGWITNTTPRGAYLRPMNPLSVVMGIANVSFLAQTATWYPLHLDETLRRAWAHKGLSFVRILQRCPVYMPDLFAGGGRMAARLLQHDEGISVDKSMQRAGTLVPHDPHDIHAAQRVALEEEPAPMGLIYWDPEVPSYEEVRYSYAPPVDNDGLLARLNDHLDKYTVQ